MTIRRWAGVGVALAVAGLGVLGLSSPAHANHNEVTVEYSQPKGCKEVVLDSAWTGGEHRVANAVLVVRIEGQVTSAAIGQPIGVGPFGKPTVVEYRVWGGGERDYDSPALLDLDALVAHLGIGGSVIAPDAPGVAWHKLRVKGCAVPEEPTVVLYDCADGPDAGELVIPEVEGVVYDTESGPVPPGTYTVTAEPAKGYKFPYDATREWELVVPPVNGCPGEPGEPGEPGDPGEPGTPGEPGEPGEPGDDGQDGSDGSDGTGAPVDKAAQLPLTGTGTPALAGLGAGLIGLGSVLAGGVWWAGRRRRALLAADH